ncbi:MAG: hypothetical protein AB7U35_07375 [Sphingobium sp.]
MLAAPAAARKSDERRQRVFTNPSDIVAAEIAFNRLAQEKGQWTAFRETAADDAVMFVPQKVLAQDWLKKRTDPPASVKWQPLRVYISCNGRLAESTGAWQRPDGSQGYFTTIWRLDDKGRWKWVLDHGDALANPLAASDMVEGHVATCRRSDRPRDPDAAPPEDESLLWDYDVAPDGGREVRVRVWDGSAYQKVIDDRVKAP